MIELRSIGIVGGLGPGATILYYQQLTRAFAARSSEPRLFVAHADRAVVGTLLSRGAVDELGEYIAGHIAALRRAGAEFAAIGAVAPHVCAAYLRSKADLPLLDVTDCIRLELTRRRVKRLAVFGHRTVMESTVFRRLDDWTVVHLTQDEIEFVHKTYMRIASGASVSNLDADVGNLRSLGKDLVHNRGAELVVLAGTDLSIALDEATCGFPALDCTRLHVEAILAHAYGAPALAIYNMGENVEQN